MYVSVPCATGGHTPSSTSAGRSQAQEEAAPLIQHKARDELLDSKLQPKYPTYQEASNRHNLEKSTEYQDLSVKRQAKLPPRDFPAHKPSLFVAVPGLQRLDAAKAAWNALQISTVPHGLVRQVQSREGHQICKNKLTDLSILKAQPGLKQRLSRRISGRNGGQRCTLWQFGDDDVTWALFHRHNRCPPLQVRR